MIETVKITTEFIKLDQLLKFANVAPTGGIAKEMVADGIVKVNGEECLMRGKKLRPGDVVTVEFDALLLSQKSVYHEMVAAEDADNMGGITLYLMLRMRRHGGGCSPFGKYAAFYHLERIFLQKWAVLLFLLRIFI